MSHFLTPLKLEEVGEDQWQLLDSLEYESDLLGHCITVPKGFTTDLESIPRWLPLIYAMLYGIAHAASVIHDYLYTLAIVTRRNADAVLYEAIVATGQPQWKAWLIWIGVRMGGGVAWKKHRDSHD